MAKLYSRLFFIILISTTFLASLSSADELAQKLEPLIIEGTKNEKKSISAKVVEEAFGNGRTIELSNVVLNEDLVLNGNHERSITIIDSRLKSITINNNTASDVQIVKTEITGNVILNKTKAEEFLIRESELAGKLELNETELKEFMIEKNFFKNTSIELNKSKVTENLFISNNTGSTNIELRGTDVANIFLIEGSNIKNLGISRAQIRFFTLNNNEIELFYIAASYITEEILISGVTVIKRSRIDASTLNSPKLIIRGSSFHGDFVIAGREPKGLFDDDTTNSNTRGFSGINITDSDFAKRLALNTITIKESFNLYHSRLKRTQMRKVNIIKDLTINSSEFASNLSISSSRFNNEVKLENSVFNSKIYFNKNIFLGQIDFLDNEYFSRIDIPWFSSEFNTGLKGRIQYDEVTITRLRESYKERGMNMEYRDVYYNHKKTESKNKTTWEALVDMYFLDLTFGYGVKPTKFITTFLISILVFAIAYFLFVPRAIPKYKCRNNEPYPKNTQLILNRFKAYFTSWKFSHLVWAVHHSFDQQTPGVEMGSTKPAATVDIDSNLVKSSKLFMLLENCQKIWGWYLLLLLAVMIGKIID